MFKPNFWKQTDRRWSGKSYGGMTLGAGGCGPTTIANIVSALKNKPGITPAKVWNYMKKKGYIIPGAGSTWDGITKTLKHYGIKFKVTYSDSEVKKSLKAGNWVLALAGPSRWTSSGHYFCIYDMRASGKLSISDPYSSSDYCQKDGTIDEYLRANKCNWISINPKAYPGYLKYKGKNTKVSTMYVNNATSNIRKGRSTKTGVAAKVKRGLKLKVYSYQNGWWRIYSGKYKGYYIHEHQLTAFEPYEHWYKAKTAMNVRMGPASGSDIVGIIKKGTKIKSTKRSGDWIYNPAKHGWVRTKSADRTRTYMEYIK